MVITIKSMTLKNFKGVLGERKVEFSPTITQIYGANKSGKTTIADAFRWCLFGKNCEGKTTFGIETKDESGKLLPITEHEVQLVLDVDGREVTLRRVYVTKWVTEDGAKRVAGHTTNYFVDGNKYQEKDYKEYIATFCNEALFMSITNPSYFTSLPAEQQRALLTEMVGEVSMEELSAGNKDFEQLLEQMQGEQMERFLEHLAYKKKEVKAELERIPVRISEQQNDIAQLEQDSDWAALEKELAATESAIARIEEELADRSKVEDSKYERLAAMRKAINELKAKRQQMESQHQQAYSSECMKWEHDKAMAKQRISQAQSTQQLITNNKEAAQKYLQGFEEQAAKKEQAWQEQCAAFRTRWADAKAEQFTYDEDSQEFVCPTCKRRLEAEDIEEAVQRMQENWNTAHAKKMQQLNAEAHEMKAKHEHEVEQDNMLRANQDTIVSKADEELEAARQQEQEAQLELEKLEAHTITSVQVRIEADAAIGEVVAEIAAKEEELAAAQSAGGNGEDAGIESLKADKQQMVAKRDSQKALLANKQAIERKQKRIEKLEKQEAELNSQLTELESQEYKAQQLMEEEITELESKVNGLFTMVRFEMFEHKLNGALKTKCECLVGGVPFGDLNSADRINAGIDITNAICKYKGVYAPCFIDNAESINNVLPMQSQCIQLIVSRDKTLVVRAN